MGLLVRECVCEFIAEIRSSLEAEPNNASERTLWIHSAIERKLIRPSNSRYTSSLLLAPNDTHTRTCGKRFPQAEVPLPIARVDGDDYLRIVHLLEVGF